MPTGATRLFLAVLDVGGRNYEDTGSFQVSVAVLRVNQPSRFTKGADLSVDEGARPQTVANWAKDISAGPPDEAGQKLTFVLNTGKSTLFSAPPMIDAAGTLTYAAAPKANGVAHVTVTLKDDGGTGNGGKDTSDPQGLTTAVKAASPLQIGGVSVSLDGASISFTW